MASNKIADVVRFFRDELKDIYDKEEIEVFIGFCFEEFLNIKRSEINLRKEETITESELLKFNFAVKDLKQQKPIQYILGKADFYGLQFNVNENVLIPRPETEELVDVILKEFKVGNSILKNSQINILDIGTGSGCIAISLKKNIPSSMVSAIDVSDDALAVAKRNAVANHVEINFIQDDILNQTYNFQLSTFDIIVSNPPYVCYSEKMEMRDNVLKYEPHLALFVDDSNPLLFYKSIANFAKQYLKPKGTLYFEINPLFDSQTKMLLEEVGFKNVTLIKDLNNKNRILRSEI